jgi:hypothetical protein
VWRPQALPRRPPTGVCFAVPNVVAQAPTNMSFTVVAGAAVWSSVHTAYSASALPGPPEDVVPLPPLRNSKVRVAVFVASAPSRHTVHNVTASLKRVLGNTPLHEKHAQKMKTHGTKNFSPKSVPFIYFHSSPRTH